jgi:hypothetical protein
MEEQIRANAELVLQELRKLSGADFDYTQEAVEWLEGYIDRLRNSTEFENAEIRDELTSMFGCFLGECIVRQYGGVWAQHEETWCVVFGGGNKAFPFVKVAKQFEYGLGDGILSFFHVIPVIADSSAHSSPDVSQKPWWKFW